MVTLTRLSCAAAVFAAVIASGTAPGWAEELTVNADQSQIIALPRAPSTVVVGNPSIADVTIQGNQIFVHGRIFGKTNIIVLDESGGQMAAYDVNVGADDSYNVVMYRPMPVVGGMWKQSFTCKTDCEMIFHVGDDNDTAKIMNEQQKNKLGLAQGQKSGENGGNGAQAAPPQ